MLVSHRGMGILFTSRDFIFLLVVAWENPSIGLARSRGQNVWLLDTAFLTLEQTMTLLTIK